MAEKTIIFNDLRDKILEYMPENEVDIVRSAYMYAYELHFGVKRLTGEDYINHPLNVAYILTDIKADFETISAALLHDIIEDTDTTKEELANKFGNIIANLVDGVTKISKLSLVGNTDSVIANHQKIIVGLAEDVRVIIIKLADRMHNMKTLWVLPEKKQKIKAKETLDILVPIAHRLGMHKFKSELEDLSLRYYKPDAFYQVVESLNKSKKERDASVLHMQEAVTELLNKHNIKHEIKGRSKSIYSIYKKLDKGKKFSDIYDLLALRIYVNTESECYQVLGIIHSKFKPLPKRFKDYIAMPKTNMYQSLHTTVFGVDKALYEIQIRTYEMDEIAEKGIASHWSYKEKGSNVKAEMQSVMEQKLQFFKSIIELRDTVSEDDTFVKSVTEEVFKNTIYVFTPKGDVIELPKGSTPIDFAYKVHSKVGDHMVGAIVNGKIVSLDDELSDSDVIKINTNPNTPGPSKEWINMAKTNQAKSKIKAFFNKIDKESHVKTGEESIKEELRKRKIPYNDFFTDENTDKALKEFKCADLEELYSSIGSGKQSATGVIKTILNENESKEEVILKKATGKKVKTTQTASDIIVGDIDDIKTSIASCCKPVPGDDIVGYITKGEGISVHRASCPNISDLEERIIDVNWNETLTGKYNTSILIHVMNSKNLLMDIISKTTTLDISILSINTRTTDDSTIYDLTVSVLDTEKLDKFILDIRSIPDVLDVERIIK